MGNSLRRGNTGRWAVALVLVLFALIECRATTIPVKSPTRHGIRSGREAVEISAGILQRTISLGSRNVTTTKLSVDDSTWLAGPARELSFTVSFARPNQKPQGLPPGATPAVETTAHFSPAVDSARVGPPDESGVEWERAVRVEANAWSAHFDDIQQRITRPGEGRQRLIIRAQARRDSALAGLRVDLYYEVYEGFPVIRKWVEVSNRGRRWLKLDRMVIDDVEFAAPSRHQIPLTPGEQGAGPSVIAFENENSDRGVIAVSEIPSALRRTEATGAMGYTPALFEWVLGPGERFTSEPVFHFAYSGPVEKTVSALSTPRDRAVETGYREFLRQHIGVAADARTIYTPQWCSWSNFGQELTDAIIREQSAIAARCGFALVLLDQGWQNGLVGTEPDPRKFPQFADTCRYLRSLGLKIGLWVSCYRSTGSADLRAMPEGRSAPLILRDDGFGMSFASPWRRYYAESLAGLSRKYGVSYFKQDFTNIKFGDIAEGHESRTRKESLLRGLRGLLEAQGWLGQAAPRVTPEITHEIYWGTPGVPCDVAALKHAAAYHIPPNDYAGVGHGKQRVADNWPYDPAKLRQQLLTGCFNARQRFYAHRGLPLYALEYYAAHAVNFHGSLTPEVQDRQVCSWLMGVPSVFAGDLASLTEENILRYRRRFDRLRRLETDYGLYRNFQFSGVPAPTDTDWHWWGKLNEQGGGAVVVLRGSQGEDERAVNIPWVPADRAYQVTALLADRPLGRFRGDQLQQGSLKLALPRLGQEILELKPTRLR